MNAYRFTKVVLRNWKNFPEADVDLGRRVFIVGRNAIGKSNFIDVFRFLRDLVLSGGGLAMAIHKRDGISNVRSRFNHGTDTKIKVQVRVQNEAHEGWEYELVFDEAKRHDSRAPGGKSLAICAESLKEIGRENPAHIKRGVGVWKQGGSQTLLENENAIDRFRGFIDFLAGTIYLHLVPQMVRENQGPLTDAIGADSFGRGLLEQIKATPGVEKRKRLKTIQAILQKVNPQFSGLEQVEDAAGRPHLQVVFKDWRMYGSKQDERQFSDGTLRLIGLLWSLQMPGGTILLEEPELSLHAGLAGELAPYLAQMSRKFGNRQIMVATHSEALMADEGIRPSEILLVQQAKEGSVVTQGAKIEAVNRQLNAGLLASQAVLPMVYGPVTEPVFTISEKIK